MRHPITLIMLILSALLVAGCGGRVVTSGDYTLESDRTLSGNLTLFSGDATLEEGTHVTGDVFMTSGNLDANGEIDGNIILTSGNVDLGSEAVVHGDILATSGNVRRAEGSRVEGEILTDSSSFTVNRGLIARVFGTFCALPLIFLAVLIALFTTFARRRPAPALQTATSLAAPAQKLRQLREMLERGLITESDFENTKADILSKM